MRIFYYCFEGFSKLGVVNKHVTEVIANLSRMGHRISLFVPGISTVDLDADIDISYIPVVGPSALKWILYDVFSFFYLLIGSLKERPDVIYFRETHSFVPLIVSKLIRRPLVIEVNGWVLEELRMIGYSRWKLGFLAFCQRHNFRRASGLVAVTEGLKELIRMSYGVDERRIAVVPNGTNPEIFRPLETAVCRKRLGLDVTRDYVGFIGSCYAYHGLDYLIDCAPLVLKACPDVRFMIAGDGDRRTAWQDKVKRMGLEDEFDFPGRVPYSDAPCYINSFSVCVAPWQKEYPNRIGLSPMKLFDYMACGRPVVLSAVRGVREIVERHNTGLAVDVENSEVFAGALVALLKDEASRIAMGENGRRLVERSFTWEVTARKIEGVLEEVLAASPATTGI